MRVLKRRDGTLVANHPRWRAVFLWSDGLTDVVEYVGDNSDLRAALVKGHGPESRIVGSSDPEHIGWTSREVAE